MTPVVFVMAIALLGSVALFVLGVLDGRPQRIGLAFSLVAAAIYLVYYSDALISNDALPRDLIHPLGVFGHFDTNFVSTAALALVLIPVYVVRIGIYLRVSVDRNVTHVSDRIVNFLSALTASILLGGVLDSGYHGGWALVSVYAAVIITMYVVTAAFSGIGELIREAGPYLWVRTRRLVSPLIKEIAKVLSVLASLHKRLGLNMERWTLQLHGATRAEKMKFRDQRERENRELDQTHKTGRHTPSPQAKEPVR